MSDQLLELAEKCGGIPRGRCGPTSASALVMTNDAIAKFAAALSSAPTGVKEWRCFHCDESFVDEASAAAHFGTGLMHEPACQIDITKYREMEELHRRHCEEDTDLHRQIYSLQSDHQIALRREEEKGYARGLMDAVLYPADAANSAASAQPVFDLERMEKALAGPRYTVPSGLSREGVREFILNVAASTPPVPAEMSDEGLLELLRSALDCDGYGYWLPDICVKEGDKFGQGEAPTLEEFKERLFAALRGKEQQ